MATVWRDKKYTVLSERLVMKETLYCGQKIFPHYRELIMFAAMVGFYYGKQVPVKDKAYEIPQDIFENADKDAYVYLCALQDQKDGNIFREENNNECWKIFESYANYGLEVIDNWLLDSPGDTDGVDTILNEMKIIAGDLQGTTETGVDLENLEF
jgi:dnd system-associated protein 4